MLGLAFLVSFLILLYGVLKGYFIGFCLLLSYIIFYFLALKMGYEKKHILDYSWKGGKKAFLVLSIFVLIGLVTASWFAAGTIPAIVYYSISMMNSRFFLVFSFLASCLVSYMLGTALGTASTIGVVLIIMARTGLINLNMVGGAILAGAFFGDRLSPMSSSASLVANLTGVELYPMLKKFQRTTMIPLLISIGFYSILSLFNPLEIGDSRILVELKNNYIINPIILLPALGILFLSLIQVNVKKAMIVSVFLGSIIGLYIQKLPLSELIRILLMGYKLDPSHSLSTILKGGGLMSMVKPGFTIFVSCAMAGILEGIDLFKRIEGYFERFKSRSQLLLATAITSVLTAAFGGNQSIAVVMTIGAMEDLYEKRGLDNYELAVDIGNTAILFSPMIPWNIANLVPATSLNLEPAKIVPYAFYLYIPFVVNYVLLSRTKLKERSLKGI